MTTTINLSQKQQEIVFHKQGPILVNASAGSGKTRVITERIKFLLTETKRKILAITFTNKAGEEMKERLENISLSRNRLFIGTFHSFCQQVLENHGKVIGLPNMPHIFEDEADRLRIIEQAIEATPSYFSIYQQKDKKEKGNFLLNMSALISQTKRQLLSEEQLSKENADDDFVLLNKTYQEILYSLNAIDFDDLILLCYNLFAEQTAVTDLYRRTYEYICIDEAQDLNNAQYQLLRILTSTEHVNLMMVGDPNQSIFAFNGSSSDFMNKSFVEDYQPKVIELKENYRSSKEVLNAAEKIIPTSLDIRNTVIEGLFEIHYAVDEKDEAAWICNKVMELVALNEHKDIEGQITFEKIAVLARNKYVFAQLEETLQTREVSFHYKISPGPIKFESNIMKIFDMALRVKLNPQDTLHFNRLLELLKEQQIKDLNTLANIVEGRIEKYMINLVIGLHSDGSNFKSSLNNFANYVKSDAEIEDYNEKKMMLNDIAEVLKHWYNYAVKTEKQSLHQFKNSMALGNTNPLVQKKGLTLSTIHTMKGLEYDIVFLMGMDDDTFPDYRAIRIGGAEMRQERNNLYVAFTRAKRFLYVTWPKKRLMPWGDVKPRNISRLLKEFN